MKYQVYTEEKKEEEKPILLQLHQEHSGAVSLRAVDAAGKPVFGGILLWLQTNGKVYACPCINEDLGFPLDKAGRLQFVVIQKES